MHKCKFKHSFQDTLNPTSSWGFDKESTSHYNLHCRMNNDERHTLLSTKEIIDCRFLDVVETIFIKTFLFGNFPVDAQTNAQILIATIEYILTNLFHSFLFFPLYNGENMTS